MLKRKLKIGVDIRPLMSSRYCGVGEYLYQLLVGLSELCSEHEFYLFGNSFRENDFSFLPRQENVHLKVSRLPNKLLNGAFYFFGAPGLDRLIRKSLDVFWLPNLNFIPRLRGVPLVLTLHDLSFLRYPEYFSLKQRFWHTLVSPGKLIEEARSVIAVSSYTQKEIHRFYKPQAGKVHVVSSGVSSEMKQVKDPWLRSKVRSKYQLPHQFVLYFASIEPRKNLIGVVIAFEKWIRRTHAKSIYLVIAGSQSWMTRSVRDYIENSPVKSFIKWIGFIDSKDKAVLYSLSSLVVYPSFYEGFGFPLLEALCCQTPVLGSIYGALPEIVGEAAFLVDPYSLDHLSCAMETAFSSKVNFETARFLKQKYNWRKTARETLALIEAVVE